MKTIKYILAACIALSCLCVYSQVPKTSLSEEEAISFVKNNYQFKYFRNPTDTLTNLNNFIETVDKIVPMSNQKKNTLKEQAMATVRRQTDRLPLSEQVIYYRFIPGEIIYLMDTNVIDVVRNNFSEDEFARIYEAMHQDRLKASQGYYVLRILQKYKHNGVPQSAKSVATREDALESIKNMPSQKEEIDSVFEDFNID
jgi:hypothetical protein